MKLHPLFCLAALAFGLSGSPAQESETLEITNVNPPMVELTNTAVEAQAAASRYSDQGVVAFGRDAHLAAGRDAHEVVAIGGNARAEGPVRDAVVAVLGNASATDKVGDAVVAVLGNAEARGDVGDAVVAILGNARAEGRVRDAVVAILGNVTLGSNAVVHGDAVAIGGTVTLEEGAEVRGTVQEIAFGIPGLTNFQELPVWIRECLFKLRPLSLKVTWPWIVTGVCLMIYLLVSVAFPRPVEVCLNELRMRPATTFFVGLMTKILLPVLAVVLAATGIGLLAVPFLFAAVMCAAIIGKAAMLQYLGSALTRAFGVTGMAANLLALALGAIIIVALYLVPVIGFLSFAIFGTWALGAVVTAMFNYMSREKPRPPAAMPPTGYGGPGSLGHAPVPPVNPAPVGSPASTAPGAPTASAYPLAGFWERMGAAFLDLALLAIPFALLGPIAILVALAYFAGMWTWKGTTLGGLILRHQIIRYSGERLTFPVALVRGVAAMFSAVMLFLGFFWIGWNRDKQGWHDLIAGTYVVRLPQAVPLVCL